MRDADGEGAWTVCGLLVYATGVLCFQRPLYIYLAIRIHLVGRNALAKLRHRSTRGLTSLHSCPLYVPLEQMAQPGLALSLLQELGLAQAVYAPPENLTQSLLEEGYDWARGAAVARAAARVLAFREGLEAQTEAEMLQERTACEEGSAGEGILNAPAAAMAEAAAVGSNLSEGGVTTTTTSVATGNGGVDGGSSDLIKHAMNLQSSKSSNVSKDEVGGTVEGKPVLEAVVAACSGSALVAAEREGEHDTAIATGAAPTGEETANDARKPTPKEKEKAKSVIEGKPGAKKDGEAGGNQASSEPRTFVRELFLSAALVPLVGVQHKMKKKFVPAAQSIVQESLKVPFYTLVGLLSNSIVVAHLPMGLLNVPLDASLGVTFTRLFLLRRAPAILWPSP